MVVSLVILATIGITDWIRSAFPSTQQRSFGSLFFTMTVGVIFLLNEGGIGSPIAFANLILYVIYGIMIRDGSAMLDGLLETRKLKRKSNSTTSDHTASADDIAGARPNEHNSYPLQEFPVL